MRNKNTNEINVVRINSEYLFAMGNSKFKIR
jgi:hypothetical protein